MKTLKNTVEVVGIAVMVGGLIWWVFDGITPSKIFLLGTFVLWVGYNINNPKE